MLLAETRRLLAIEQSSGGNPKHGDDAEQKHNCGVPAERSHYNRNENENFARSKSNLTVAKLNSAGAKQ
jgi:hypothetical protein